MTANGWGRKVAGIALLLTLLPGVCLAQTPGPTGSFGDLPRRVRSGKVVIVTNETGRRIRGKVAEVTGSSLVVLTKDQSGQWATRETFTPSTVREIRQTGPIWDKAVLGFGIGFFAGFVVTEDCTGCSKASGGMFVGGVGAGIGLAFDAGFGPKLVYRAPGSRRAQVALFPVLGGDRTGVALALRF